MYLRGIWVKIVYYLGAKVKEENTKITISLTKETVDFFKEEAKKHHTQYQKMIRNLLDVYVAKQSQH
jgi:predicted DNA binding CopG/RHH family protein